MNNKLKRFESLLLAGFLVTLFISCNNDFVDINSDLVNTEVATNFALDSLEYDVVAYNLPLGPVQSNNLSINYIGVYEDGYGGSNYNFVSQIGPTIYDPEFGDSVSIDSVTFYIPYFSTNLGSDDDGRIQYQLDSVFGDKPIKISLFESEYFLRDFDPDGEIGDFQRYYSNKSASESEPIPDNTLEGPVILAEDTIRVSNRSIYLTRGDDVTDSLFPGFYFKLDTLFWRQKIIDKQGSLELSNESSFRNYFRGVYFKTEGIENDGSLLGMNLGNGQANITIYYKNENSDNPENVDEDGNPQQFTYRFNFENNQVNFIENDFTGTIPVGDMEDGDQSLYLKGGEGSLAGIELFKGETDTGEDRLQAFKDAFAEFDENGEFIAYKRLINEANLVLYVDQSQINGIEPDRIYLYDLDNQTPLIDYATDAFVATIPRLSISSHLGILQREGGEPDGKGIRYTMKLTNHLLNIIDSDSTNVRLGLAVASNVNLEIDASQGDVQEIDGSAEAVPLSSITSPKGTVLHGNRSLNSEFALRLKIFYTCLEDIEDCGSDN